MWKAAAYTLVVELFLYGVGKLTVPTWVDENIHIWLPISITVLFAMACYDNWPRFFTWQHKHRWLDLDAAARFFRDEAERQGLRGIDWFFDTGELDIGVDGSAIERFRHWLDIGVARGEIVLWGTPERSNKPRLITEIEKLQRHCLKRPMKSYGSTARGSLAQK